MVPSECEIGTFGNKMRMVYRLFKNLVALHASRKGWWIIDNNFLSFTDACIERAWRAAATVYSPWRRDSVGE